MKTLNFYHRKLWGLTFLLSSLSSLNARPLLSWMELALENNANIEQAKAQVEEAEAGLIEVRSYSLPSVDVGVTAARTNNPLQTFGMKVMQSDASFNDFGVNEFNPMDPNVGETRPSNLNDPDAINDFGLFMQVQMPLFTGGQLYHNRKMVNSGIKAAKEAKKMNDQQTLFNVIQNYAKTKGANAYYNVASTAESTYLRLVDMIEKMNAEGLTSQSDLLSAQLKLGEARLNKQEAFDQSLESLSELKLTAGVAINQEETIENENFKWESTFDQNHCIESVLKNPGVQALKHQGKMKEAEVSASRAAWWPEVGAQAKIETHAPDQIKVDDYSYTIGLQAKWNIFAGGNTYAKTSQAQAKQRHWKSQYQSTVQKMIQQCEKIERDITRAEANLKSKQNAVELATEAFRIVNHRYSEGLTTLVEWFGAQTQLEKAEADLVAAQIAYDMQNAAALFIRGELTVENIGIQ